MLRFLVFAAASVSGFGMGCDGGTIPKRHELVKGPKKVEKVSGDYGARDEQCLPLLMEVFAVTEQYD